MEFLSDLLNGDSKGICQFLKYAFSGVVATIVHISLFHLCAWKVFPALQEEDWFVKILKIKLTEHHESLRSRYSMYDNGIAFLVANFVCYLLNIYFVFEAGRYHWLIEILLFYMVSGVSIAIGTFLMGFLIRKYKMLTTYAFGANLFSSLMINFVMRKYFIFNG